jgi:serine phosphatase RsbU (regulator of sigma subunit)
MTKRFREMLLEIHGMPMKEQKELLTKRIHEWMGENHQIDDILIIGIRI